MKLTVNNYTIEGTRDDIKWFLQEFPPYPILKDIKICSDTHL